MRLTHTEEPNIPTKDNTGAEKTNLAPKNVKHRKSMPTHLKQRKLQTVLTWVFSIVAALALAFFTRAFIAEPFEIPSASMLQTLKVGDRLIGEKITYKFSDPKRGDIATFNDPENASITIIKRVIGVPGDTIDIHDGAVYLNGERQNEPYTNGQSTYPLQEFAPFLKGPLSYPYTLNEGEYWMMGDNRGNSLDSRYFGPIARKEMTSKAWFIFWPFNESRFF